MPDDLTVGSCVDGKVLKIKPFGAVVALGGGRQGLVHISHVSDKFVQDIKEHVYIGDVVRVKILSIDETSGKIALSIKEADSYQKGAPEPVVDEQEPPRRANKESSTFEDKFKDWVRASNELQAALNKRKKRK